MESREGRIEREEECRVGKEGWRGRRRNGGWKRRDERRKKGWREKGGMERERKDGRGKGIAPPIGCLSTKSGGGFAGRGRGGAEDCWGAEVGAREAAGPPPAAILWQYLP